MNLVYGLVWALMYTISLFPFWLLHRFSDLTYILVYYVLGYRKKVVRGNLERSFPEKTKKEILEIEKKFYQGFCDVIFEAIKTITITKEEMLKRAVLVTPDLLTDLNDRKLNAAGITGHLGNWEWLSLAVCMSSKQQIYGLFNPLSNKFFNDTMLKNRSRFGTVMLEGKNIKGLYRQMDKWPFGVGVFADQAPRYYPKAVVVQFLNQKTYFAPGSGLMIAQQGMVPLWSWMRRVGRSRYEYGIELMNPKARGSEFKAEDDAQIEYLSKQLNLTQEQAAIVLYVTQDFSQRLEAQIKMAPQDWLWSHRRWKDR